MTAPTGTNPTGGPSASTRPGPKPLVGKRLPRDHGAVASHRTPASARVVRVGLVGRGHPEQGGIPVMLDQVLGFADHRTEISLVNLTPGHGDGGGHLDGASLGRTALDLIRVFRAARRHDVIHLHSALAPLTTMIRAGALIAAARAGRARIIVHAHGGRLPLWMTTDVRHRIARRCLRLADRVVVVATPVGEALRPVLDGRGPIEMANGIDLTRFRPAGDRRPDCFSLATPGGRGPVPTVLYVGHLSEQKGLAELLDASTRILAAGHHHRLVLAGADRLPERLRGLLDADHVEALGPIHPADMPALYRSADIFCLPSHWEAMPLAVLEAMASGLPVVATRVGQLPHMVATGSSGFLVEAGTVVPLANALASLVAAPDERRRMGRAARRAAEARFAEQILRRQLVELYHEVAR